MNTQIESNTPTPPPSVARSRSPTWAHDPIAMRSAWMARNNVKPAYSRPSLAKVAPFGLGAPSKAWPAIGRLSR